MPDETEAPRRERLVEINADPGSREALEARYSQVCDTNQMRADFEVLGFSRRSDGVRGSLEFQHTPRYLFRWEPE